MEARDPSNESDSIRVGARDLILVLRLFRTEPEMSLEIVRLCICHHRGKSRALETLATTARDLAVELQKLGLVKGGPYPKTKSDYNRLKENVIRLTPEGQELLKLIERPAEIYDALFTRMFAAHRSIRDYARVLAEEGKLVAPVLTSFKDHVAGEYASAQTLHEEIRSGKFRTGSMLKQLQERVGRSLEADARREMEGKIQEMVAQLKQAPAQTDTTAFAKAVLSRLNDIVIPTVLGSRGLSYDFRTHRSVWSLGEEFRVWASTSFHPKFQGTVIFPTATLQTSKDGRDLIGLQFEASLAKLRDQFLSRLYQVCSELQKLGRGTLVPALELRATFCCEFHTHPSTFDRLFDEQYARDDSPYEVHTEIQRQRPRHEKPLRAGERNIGLVLVTKRKDS
jgi:hypothetical protein